MYRERGYAENSQKRYYGGGLVWIESWQVLRAGCVKKGTSPIFRENPKERDQKN